MTIAVRPATAPPQPLSPYGTLPPGTPDWCAFVLRNIMSLAWRNLVQIKHNPMELLGLSVQPIMFMLLFAYVFGPPMAGSVHAYLPVVIPGIIAQNALFASLATGFGLNVDISKGVFDRFRSLPIARTAPLTGRVVADAVKQAWSASVLLLAGYLIGFRIHTGVLATVTALVLLLVFAALVSWVTVFIGLSVDSPEKVQIFGFTLVFPMSFLSTVFIQISPGTPAWLAFVMRNNPVSHLAEAIRGLLLGAPAAHHAAVAMVWAGAIAVLFVPLSAWRFRRRM